MKSKISSTSVWSRGTSISPFFTASSSPITASLHNSESGTFIYFIFCLIVLEERNLMSVLHSKEVFLKFLPNFVLKSSSCKLASNLTPSLLQLIQVLEKLKNLELNITLG